LYGGDGAYTFMDKENYEQHTLSTDDVGEAVNFLIENLDVTILFFEGRAIGVDVPRSVELRVTQTDPGLKGNTVSGGSKPATLETGFVVQVPLHINEGDILKVDTSTGKYVE